MVPCAGCWCLGYVHSSVPSSNTEGIFNKPIPLSFLCLGTFDSPPETRKEKAEDGGLLDSFRHQHISVYPFTIYHAANKLGRRYTLYANSEGVRKKWHDALVDALGVHRVRQEANMVGLVFSSRQRELTQGCSGSGSIRTRLLMGTSRCRLHASSMINHQD